MFLSTVTSKTAQELSWTDAKSCPVAAEMPAIVLLTHWLTPYEPDLCAAIWRAWKALYNVDESTLNENKKHINDDNRTFATIVTHMWQNRHDGEQGTHWEKTKREITLLNGVSSLFLLPQCIPCSAWWFCTTWMTSYKAKGLTVLTQNIWLKKSNVYTADKQKEN